MPRRREDRRVQRVPVLRGFGRRGKAECQVARTAVELREQRLLPDRDVHQVILRGPACGVADLVELTLAQALHGLVELAPRGVEADEGGGGSLSCGHGAPPRPPMTPLVSVRERRKLMQFHPSRCAQAQACAIAVMRRRPGPPTGRPSRSSTSLSGATRVNGSKGGAMSPYSIAIAAGETPS